MKWTSEKPTEDGFYWLLREDRAAVIVYVWGLSDGYPWVSWSGNDMDSKLEEVQGSWAGPILEPED